MRMEHVAGAIALQRECFPPPFPQELLWRSEHLERHLKIFPEGQFVAVSEGRVIGSASNLRISEETWERHGSWDETVGGPTFANHDHHGTTLYGADISVSPHARGKGVARALYDARFRLVLAKKLVRYGTACRIPDYLSFRQQTSGTTQQYIVGVRDESTTDRTLTPLLRIGLKIVAVLDDYMEDEESGNAAVLLSWLPS